MSDAIPADIKVKAGSASCEFFALVAEGEGEADAIIAIVSNALVSERQNSHRDLDVRQNPALRGRVAYEASIAAAPLYHDGTPRKPWDQLGDVERWSWERPVSTKPSIGSADV
ncbi:hypothetical protein KYK30_31920 [Shinella yambaruensis]|uniref:Uncharacterized protein n=1 Tax=Shinella yambaruensis TaxID=415996 RepID=A0ABQ5ZWT6_9HYPH|nr:hypothetical protein [Shinella yambaruensis]MCJ8030042.1 hypothetical protein [Shinella yambaruensis]MCU7984334.1 hypothetical protein [Shinella yambaruensis]GLR55162.1 hypothetical protein GCM10007923_63830 [Shinella yambaruensis]